MSYVATESACNPNGPTCHAVMMRGWKRRDQREPSIERRLVILADTKLTLPTPPPPPSHPAPATSSPTAAVALRDAVILHRALLPASHRFLEQALLLSLSPPPAAQLETKPASEGALGRAVLPPSPVLDLSALIRTWTDWFPPPVSTPYGFRLFRFLLVLISLIYIFFSL